MLRQVQTVTGGDPPGRRGARSTRANEAGRTDLDRIEAGTQQIEAQSVPGIGTPTDIPEADDED